MNESEHKSGLYRWERQSKPKVYSRSQRVTSHDDIQDWIKKVENASVRATDAAFGLVPSGKEKGRIAAQVKSRQVREQEEAYSEAQELLSQWVNDKVRFDEDDGLDDLEAWRRARSMKKDKSEGHGLTGANQAMAGVDDEPLSRWTSSSLHSGIDSSWAVDETAIYERVKRSALGDEDPYAGLLEMDEQDAVSSVLKAMMTKEVIKDTFKKDVDDVERNVPDPRTKMELRHRMVKDNRERRQEQEKRRLEEKQMKKEARLRAQQMVLKEQREKENKTKKEEAEIKKEMTRIRKELAEENRKREEVLRREREEKELMARLAEEELERQKKAEEEELLLSHRNESERRKKQIIKEELWRSRQESKKLKTLHTHFTAWYDLVLSRRLLMGKVKAMSDWKVMVRVWCAWKSYVRGQRAQVEADQHEKQVIESHRKMLMADRHHHSRLLRQCLEAWQSYAHEELERKAMEQEKGRTKAKMMALLSAVAEGKLNSEKESLRDGGNNDRGAKENKSALNTARSTASQSVTIRDAGRPENPIQAWVDPIESSQQQQHQQHQRKQQHKQQQQQEQQPASATSSHHRHDQSPVGGTGGRRGRPTQAWQVTTRHVQMTAEDIGRLGHTAVDEDEGDTESEQSHYTDAEIRKRFGTQPWMNRHYVVNNFEHRYNAQQRALKEQREEIKEQRRMIEELTYRQKQEQLKQQLKSPSGPATLSARTDEIEVPSRGKRIPKDDKELEEAGDDGMIQQLETPKANGNNRNNNNNNNCDNRQNQSQPQTQLAATNEADQDPGSQTLNTDRSNLTTTTTTASRSREPSSVVSVPQGNTKYLQVLKNMEDRAAQRARQKAEREEKRRKQEEEKLAELERIEEERRKQMEDEKKAKVEAYRQKKRLEKQKEEERQKEIVRQRELNEMADEHYRRALLKYRCLLPLKKLVGMSKRNWNRAVKHHRGLLMRQMFREWKLFTDNELLRKQQMADQMAEFLLVKHCFQRWKKSKYHSQFLMKRADRHFHAALRVKAFSAWTEFVVLEREASIRNDQLAQEHRLQYLLRASFLSWRYLPERQKREEERKKRKSELRQRVAELIPDFVPSASPAASQDLANQ